VLEQIARGTLRLFAASRVDRIVKAAARNPTLAALLARYATGALPYEQFKTSAPTNNHPEEDGWAPAPINVTEPSAFAQTVLRSSVTPGASRAVS
jgi:hypothetical protein